jgi:cell division control protein 6
MGSPELSEIFNHFLKQSIILKNREALRPDYVPENLPHRDEQIRKLGWILAPVLKGSRCSNMFIYGKPGTGKTAVTRFVLQHLSAKSSEIDAPLGVSYINCRVAGSEYRVLSMLSQSVKVPVPFTGISTAEVFERFKQGLKAMGGILITVLDEVDMLVKASGDKLLYELTRVNETSPTGKIVLIGISNDLNFKDLLDPRVLSSLSEEEIVFHPYTADDLYDILLERAKIALVPDGVTEGALRLCAALAAAEHGDARRALDLLRVAGELAEREGGKAITEEYIRKAQWKIEHDRVTEVLRTLPLHQRLVLYSVYYTQQSNPKQSLTGDIYETYERICKKAGLEPLTQRRVSGLLNELDAMGIVHSKLVNLGRHGRSKRVRLSIPTEQVQNLLREEVRLSGL